MFCSIVTQLRRVLRKHVFDLVEPALALFEILPEPLEDGTDFKPPVLYTVARAVREELDETVFKLSVEPG